MVTRLRIQILVGFTLVVGSIAALVWILNARRKHDQALILGSPAANGPRAIPPAAYTPSPLAPPAEVLSSTPSTLSASQTPTPDMRQSDGLRSPISPAASAKLIIPVAGIKAEQLHDSYSEARAEGRTHVAIDIPAPRGTPVLAAADGRIIRLFLSKPGGLTIYQLGTDNKTIYYYAHLDRYADGLAEGHFARQGETIAYVGDTGNAGAGNYHLHFSISIVSDPKRWWEGININPYPLLTK
jgi:peptidoglycan LD-endopeptidase LytH